MKKNIGTTDKIVRTLVAAILIALYFTKTVEGTWGIVALVFSAVLILTSIFSICPPYVLMGVNTHKCCCKDDSKECCSEKKEEKK